MRIFEGRDDIKYGKIEELDDQEVGRIRESIRSLVAINQSFWRITDKYGFPK